MLCSSGEERERVKAAIHSVIADREFRESTDLPSLLNLLGNVVPSADKHNVFQASDSGNVVRAWLLLLRILKSRERQALDAFFIALHHMRKTAYALKLQPLVSDSVLSTIENEGEIEGEEGGLIQRVRDICLQGTLNDDRPSISSSLQSEISFLARNPHTFYPNDPPGGLALIINNRNFFSLPERLGTNEDRDSLRALFQQLNYTVQVHENLSAQRMKEEVRRFASSPIHRSSAVICILSHGEHDCIFGVDDKPMSTHEMLSWLNARNAPLLAGKPKLVFVQACRGARYDLGYEEAVDAGVSGAASGLFSCLSSPIRRVRLPAEADFLVAYSTTPQYVSFRNSVKGTWFVQAVCQVFSTHFKDTDVLSMLTLVNQKVAEGFMTRDNYKQMPEYHSRTIRKLLAVHAASGGAFFWREMFTESLRSRVLSLYKTLYHMGKEYPKGADWFHVRLKKAFHNNRNESDPQKIEHLILRGEYVVKELEALYSLRKYRAIKSRYYDAENQDSKLL